MGLGNAIVSFIFRIVEPFISFLDQIGVKETLKRHLSKAWAWVVTGGSLAAAAIWAVWLWLWNLTPAWAIPFLVIGVITAVVTCIIWFVWLFLRLIEQWFATRSRLTLDKTKYREFGVDMLQLSEDMHNSIRDWEDDYPTRIYRIDDWRGAREEEAENKRKKNIRFTAKYGARVTAQFYNCHLLGIPTPDLRDSYGEPSACAKYFALAGSLLKDDQLDDARNLDKNFLWEVIG